MFHWDRTVVSIMSSSLKLKFLDGRKLNVDVVEWLGSEKLTYKDVCQKLNILNNTDSNYWDLDDENKIVVNDRLLNFLGYCGKTYTVKKLNFTKLLKNLPDIHYEQITDKKDPRKKYYVLKGADFKELLSRMRTPKVQAYKQFVFDLQTVYDKYIEMYGSYRKEEADQLVLLNDKLTAMNTKLSAFAAQQLKITQQIKLDADEERRCAEKERLRSEEERIRAEDERIRADVERMRAQEERSRSEEERLRALTRELKAEQGRQEANQRADRLEKIMLRNNTALREEIAPYVAPVAPSPEKTRMLALYVTNVPRVYYIMRRQQQSFLQADRRLINKNYRRLKVWYNVPHAVDFGNLVKKRSRNALAWDAKGNILKATSDKEYTTNASVIFFVEQTITAQNSALQLADSNESDM